MTWMEWAVLAAGLAVGYGVVSMLMGERRARERRQQDRPPERTDGGPGGNGPA